MQVVALAYCLVGIEANPVLELGDEGRVAQLCSTACHHVRPHLVNLARLGQQPHPHAVADARLCEQIMVIGLDDGSAVRQVRRHRYRVIAQTRLPASGVVTRWRERRAPQRFLHARRAVSVARGEGSPQGPGGGSFACG